MFSLHGAWCWLLVLNSVQIVTSITGTQKRLLNASIIGRFSEEIASKVLRELDHVVILMEMTGSINKSQVSGSCSQFLQRPG